MFASVPTTVNVSPSVAPMIVGVLSVVFVIVAKPSEDQDQLVASPPVSLTDIGSPIQYGPPFTAATIGNGFTRIVNASISTSEHEPSSINSKVNV